MIKTILAILFYSVVCQAYTISSGAHEPNLDFVSAKALLMFDPEKYWALTGQDDSSPAEGNKRQEQSEGFFDDNADGRGCETLLEASFWRRIVDNLWQMKLFWYFD